MLKNKVLMQVDVEDNPSDNFLLGSIDALARPSGSAILQVGHPQYDRYSYLSFTWFSLAMVWSLSTRVRDIVFL